MATVDPYDRFVSLPPAYVQRLRELRVLDDILDWDYRGWVAGLIVDAIAERGYYDRATAIALRQKAANVAARCSLGIYGPHDPVSLSNALALAADALDEMAGRRAEPVKVAPRAAPW